MLLIIQNACRQAMKNLQLNVLSLIYVLMNTLGDYITIHFRLSYKCVGSCNTYNDLSNKVCVPKKTEDLEDFVTEDFVFNIIK